MLYYGQLIAILCVLILKSYLVLHYKVHGIEQYFCISTVLSTGIINCPLTHWGRVTHICVSKLTIISSDNGLSPGRRQAIIWTNAGILLIRTLGTNFSEILGEIHSFSLSKMHMKMSSAKWRLFGLGLNELIHHEWEHLSLNSGKKTFLREKKNIKIISFTSRQSIHSSSKHVESEINPLWYGSAINCIYRLCQFQKSSHNILCCWNMTCVVGELRDLHIIDGLVKNCSNSVGYTVELLQSWSNKPLIYTSYTETVTSFWWYFHHWLHWKLSFLTTFSAASDENLV